MKKVYIADDGTEFTTEKECLEYEKKMEDIPHSFIIYDKQLNVISVEDYNDVNYIYILRDADTVIEYLSDIFGWVIEGITGEGIYAYNDDEYCWEAVDGLIADYQSKAQFLINVKDKIMNSTT